MQNPPLGQGHVPMPGHNPTAHPSVSNSRERKLKTIAWHSFKSVKIIKIVLTLVNYVAQP
jgi:hypothetical protein